jgi:hypothetical protein
LKKLTMGWRIFSFEMILSKWLKHFNFGSNYCISIKLHFSLSLDQRRLQFAVLESFSATSPDELSLAKYDIVSVIENSSSGWSWVNEPSVGSGWFPTNYLEPLVFPKKNTRRVSINDIW